MEEIELEEVTSLVDEALSIPNQKRSSTTS
jgi:hypothetical protein